ncbi:MAG: peptidase S41, partial [Ekhidna sp.]
MKTFLQLLFTLTPFMIFAQDLILKPAISPDGNEIAFSYQGDIWKVGSEGGRADRLTIHESYESNPVWLPNQQKIAFQSDRYGNNDLYLIPSQGGMTERLTYHSAYDQVYSATNEQLLFISGRIYREVERESEIYQVSVDGGTPSRFMDALGFDPVLSPDGTKVAFVRGTCRTAREAYVGPANRDVWIWTKADNSYEKLTSYEGNDFAPKWLDNENLLYISSKSGKYNVHQQSLSGVEEQLTNETEWGVMSFSFSASAKKVVYQYGDQIASFGLADKTKTIINIDVNSDYRFDPIVSEKVTNRLDEFAISPNEKLIAYGHRGELFLTKNEKEEKRTIRLTTTSDRERDVTWLNDSTLIYVSDKNGQNDLFMLTSSDDEEKNLFKTMKYKTSILKETDGDEFGPIVSPDGKKVVYRRGRGKLVVNDISSEGKLSNEKVLQDGWDTPQGVSWSPDSKWLSYGLADLNFNQDVFIHAADNSIEPVNVSMHPKYDGSPVWSKDGSKLGFISMRNNGDSDIWFLWLQQEEWEKSNEKRKREGSESDDKKESKDDKSGSEMTVQIDFDKIYNRVQQVTRYLGNESDFVFDEKGKFIYYTIGGSGRQDFEAERNLYKIKWDGSDKKEVLGGEKSPYSLTASADGKSFYSLTRGGTLYQVKGDKAEALSRSSQ